MLNNNGTAGGETFDSDSGMEVVEEPTLRPSELVRGNHNRTMSTISGKYLQLTENFQASFAFSHEIIKCCAATDLQHIHSIQV